MLSNVAMEPSAQFFSGTALLSTSVIATSNVGGGSGHIYNYRHHFVAETDLILLMQSVILDNMRMRYPICEAPATVRSHTQYSLFLASYPGPPFNLACGGPGVRKYVI